MTHNSAQLDPYLNHLEQDTRRGISALAYLNQSASPLLDELAKFQQCIRLIEPNQYFHPLDELHLTVLSIISCISDLTMDQLDLNPYREIFWEVMQKSRPITVQYRGISASSNCIVVQGFVKDDALEQLRDTLRHELRGAQLRCSFDTRYKLMTAHSSLIRFKSPLKDPSCLFATCQRYRSYEFGSLDLNQFDLVFNNWYQNRDCTHLLAHYSAITTASL
ncbi:2'-5' RNA ligase family protein [Vibrio agarilyticus]|nr:hypothetical protein [Vibrio agarilyticus]